MTEISVEPPDEVPDKISDEIPTELSNEELANFSMRY
jgi:hypothetical protein